MSAALKSYVPRPTPARVRAAGQSSPISSQPGRLLSPRSSARSAPTGQLRPLPLPTQASPLLLTLTRLQLVSSVLATALVGLCLVSYGASVYVDRQLSQATKRLSQLQRSEQQLITANALLTSHMAHQAELPTTGLQPPKPDSVIFLKPAPLRSPQAPTPAAEPGVRWPKLNPPLGY
jgi:hypothetical protein